MRYIITCFLIFVTISLSKKDDGLESPLLPLGATFQQDNLRFLLGIGQNVQGGEFNSPCECPPFRDGVGMGFTLGAYYEREIVQKLYWGVGLRFDSYSFESRYIDNQVLDAFPPAGTEAEPIKQLTSFYQIADMQIAGLGLNPQIRWYPTKSFMFRVGFNASYIFQANLTHSEELINNVTRDGQYIIQIEGDPVRSDAEFENMNPFFFSLNFGVALPFLLPNDFTLAPGFEYSIPLSSFSESYDFNVSTWRLTFEFKYPLSSRNFKKTESNI